MKVNDNWNPKKVPSSRPSEDQMNRSSMPLLGMWPSMLGDVVVAGFSPDGRYYWTGGSLDDTIRVYESATGILSKGFSTGNWSEFSARILPDGSLLCSLDHESLFRVYNIETKELVFEHSIEYDFIDSTDISPDGRKTVICFSQKPAVCFNVRHDEVKPAWTARTAGGDDILLKKAFFSPDGTLLVGKTGDGAVGIWRSEDGRYQGTVLDHAPSISPIQLSPDNSRLLCLDWENNRAMFLSTHDGSFLFQVQFDSFIQTARFSPDGRWIATGEREGRIVLWDAETGTIVREFMESGKAIRCLEFSPDNRFLLSGGEDGLARLWNVETGEVIHAHEGHLGHIFWSALSRDGQYLAYHDNTEVRFVNVKTGSEITRIKAGAASDLHFADDSRTLSFEDFTQEGQKTVSTWGVEGVHLHDRPVTDTDESLEMSRRSYSADRKHYLKRKRTPRKTIIGVPVSSGSTSIDIYESKDDGIMLQFKLPYECVGGNQRFSPDGNRFIMSEPKGYHLGNLELEEWELFLDYEDGKGVTELDISPDGTLLALGLGDGTVRLWHLDERRWIHSFEGHPNPVEGLSASNGVLFSKDGRRLMTTDIDYTFIWDLATKKCLGSIFKNGTYASKMDDRNLEQFDEGFSDALDVFLIKKGGDGKDMLFVYRC